MKKNSSEIVYIVENANWSIKWDGFYLVENLRKLGLNAKTDISFKRYENKILHFGSRNLFLPDEWKNIHPSNKVVLTYFHGDDNDKIYTDNIVQATKNTSFIHTSCYNTQKHLIKYGVPEEKIMVIPLGVDHNIFKPIDKTEKAKRKLKHNIPDNCFVIGSFQKDGNGWEEGNDPKLIKGPDIFCDAVEMISEKYPIFVVLTGPARGYVKSRLEKANIPYIHTYPEDLKEIPYYYGLLDCYIISSRTEGGPKAILEAQASGVPVISTPVGMIPDIAANNENALICKEFSPEEIASKLEILIENDNLAKKLTEKGIINSNKYSWENIAGIYYDKLYSNII